MHARVIIGLVTASVASVNAQVLTGAEVITLEAKFGTVTFSHQTHSRLDGVECRTCHHTHLEPATPIQPCHDCHAARHFAVAAIRPQGEAEGDEQPAQLPNAQEAFHALCQGCHAERKNADQPTGPSDSCRDCHV